uniref:Aminotran_5 domain-containing protein n=1 Tax=Macrostomum lignano TaxID=282301 RepID=A0A1I8F2U7_9PLAT
AAREPQWTTLSRGRWSESAAKEQKSTARCRKVHAPKPHASDSSDSEDSEEEWWSELSENAAYVYMCDNETVDGVEFKCPSARTPPGVPLVADMSSNMMSPNNGLVFAGAQKNLGPAGVTVVIVREDLMAAGPCRSVPVAQLPYYEWIANQASVLNEMIVDANLASVLNEMMVTSRNDSLYNTPPTFSIYVTGLVMQWVRRFWRCGPYAGAVRREVVLLYNLIENSQGFLLKFEDERQKFSAPSTKVSVNPGFVE